ncbi:hypothetical protein TcCL_NonESM08513 [Trypanosoma cruzi]|nr:hypothetical protein TcCL_NonESM08513 [Trypanosoma cruzi]
MGRIPTSHGRSGGELWRALRSADGRQVVVPLIVMSNFCISANPIRTAWNRAWTSELHANIFQPPTEPGHTHMGQCSVNCLPSSAAQLLQTAVCFFLFRETRMDSGFLGAVMAATECRNEVQFIPLSWNRLATNSPPANGENAAHVVAQWRASR